MTAINVSDDARINSLSKMNAFDSFLSPKNDI